MSSASVWYRRGVEHIRSSRRPSLFLVPVDHALIQITSRHFLENCKRNQQVCCRFLLFFFLNFSVITWVRLLFSRSYRAVVFHLSCSNRFSIRILVELPIRCSNAGRYKTATQLKVRHDKSLLACLASLREL
jgi:hypothetical protein